MASYIPLPGLSHIRLKVLPDLVVSAKEGFVHLDWRDPQDPSQLWRVSKSPLGGIYQFCNAQTNGYLNPSAYGDRLNVTSGPTDWFVGESVGGYHVIRLLNNEDWNLNALGNWPYDEGTHVGVWNWSGGQPNEMWMINNSSVDPQTSTCVSIIGDNAQIGVQAGDQDGKLPLICKGLNPVSSTDKTVFFWKVEHPGFGFSLRSQYNGKYLYWMGPNQNVGFANKMSLRCLWVPAAYGTYDDVALRPYLDGDQNLNVYQDPDNPVGAQIYTWSWCGGARNELWEVRDTGES